MKTMTAGPGAVGPNRPTLVETLVGKLHLPYLAGALIISLFLGGPGFVLFNYLDTQDPSEVFQRASLGSGVSELQLLLRLVYVTAFPFYLFFFVRYVRSKIVVAGPHVAAISSSGEETFNRVFGPVSEPFAPILATLPLIVAGGPSLFSAVTQFQLGLFGVAYLIVESVFFWGVAGTAVWVFVSSLIGVFRLGRQPLSLKSFHEDRMLGVKPLGSLSLHITIAFFAGLGIDILQTFIVPLSDLLPFALETIGLALLGIIAFLLPLQGMHRRMLENKQAEQARVRNEILSIYRETASDQNNSGSVADLTRILALDLAKKEIDTLPSWPFDTRIKGSFLVVLLSVLSGIIVRLIASSLKL